MYFSSDHQREHERNQGNDHEIIEIHGSIMITAWFIISQIGIWSQYFKHNRYSNYLHILCMTTVYVLSVFASSLVIGLKGFRVITQNFWHQTVGSIILFMLIPFTILVGFFSKILLSYNILQNKVLWVKKIHKFLGWSSILLIKIPLLTILFSHETSLALFILFFSIFSYSLFYYLKRTSTKMQKSLTIFSPSSAQQIHLSTYQQYVDFYQGTSYIFSNFVFILDRVKSHPGGQYLIELCRDREVDRYIYGIEGPESLTGGNKKGQIHSHSSVFFKLGQNFVDKILINQPFRVLKEVNQCQTMVMLRNRSEKLYVLYLKSKVEEKLEGFTSTSQLGRFKALKVGQKTRLYSNVQFLRYQNIKKLEKLQKIFVQGYQKCKKQDFIEPKSSTSIELQQNLLFGQSSYNFIPFFIKSYHDGQFTGNLKLLLDDTCRPPIIFSQSRGFGLALQFYYSPGQPSLILFAGGTGLNVYCDLIDLLFKQMRIKNKCSGYQQFQKLNPILKEGLLQRFRYKLYVAVDQVSEIHPITLHQCQQLAKERLLEFNVKEKNRKVIDSSRDSQIKECNQRFQKLIEINLEKDRQSVFFACGPPKMIKKIREKLEQLHVSKAKFRLI